MDEMMAILMRYPNGTYMKVVWEDGKLELLGRLDTIYETDNGVEWDSIGYKEYYACAFRVEHVMMNYTGRPCSADGLIEISEANRPDSIAVQHQGTVWTKKEIAG